MFEETEVCMLCGRPVDGRVYCSSECEALDSASPSASSASSAYPSPYLTSMKGQGNLDVPALVPSTLGHRTHHSISSSSNSSTSWSVVTDEEEGDPYVYSSESADMLSDGSKSPGYNSRLCYARRPSTTNHRATVPMLNRHTSSSASSLGVPRSVPSPFYASTEDDSSSLCISELSLHDESERESTPSQRRKRNRASLPAYFSLLQGASAGASPPSSSRARRAPSALQTMSRSLQASPTTPKVSHATVSFANAEAHIENTPRGRGRRRERDPDGRSNSSRRETARSPLRHHHLSAVQRARIDSVEKVVEWVSSSPVVNIPGRRNSSPPRKPKYEFVEALTQGLRDCAIASDDEDDDQVLREKDAARAEYERTLRGRRRAEELDVPFRGDAPGIGNGRSGLKARERGRALTGRAIGIVHR